MRKLSLAAAALAVPLVAFAGAGEALARGGFLSTWQGIYPASMTDDNLEDDCRICHGGADRGTWNPYGFEVRSGIGSGLSVAEAISAIEALDSDEDPTGTDNLGEINADTQPGWTDGNNNTIFDKDGSVLINQPPAALVAGSYDPVANQSPTADANGPYNGTEGQPLSFDGSASFDPDGSIVAWDWDFGDGNVGTGPNPSNTYAVADTYSVTLIVTDNDGATGTDTTTATIAMGNMAPTADANGPYVGTAGQPVLFDGSGSTDADGTIVAYEWDFGDGGTGTGISPAHTYAASGTFNVTLTVTDNGGLSDSAMTTAAIDPENVPPTANANGPYSGEVGVDIQFSSAGSTDSDGTIVSYLWDFGDANTSTLANPLHSYASAGSFTVILSVTDNEGATGSDTTTATIDKVNVPPTADPNGPYNGTVGSAVQFDGSGSSDSDGQIVSYMWDFGDGSTGSGIQPAHTYLEIGSFTVSLTVTDDAGASDSATTTATIGEGGLPPVANAGGPYNGIVGVPLTFDGSLSVDPDGTIVSYEWDFGDTGFGTGVSPTHTYTAPGTFNVTLTVTDNDGKTDSDSTTASISPPAVLDLDPVALRATGRASLTRGNAINIRLVVKNNGAVEGSAPATLSSLQNGVEPFPPVTITVSDPVGNGRTTFEFGPFFPSVAGDILWTVQIDDDDTTDIDVITDTTRVVD